jgi:hypothetical protein
MNAQALIQAEREAALFHLYGALLGCAMRSPVSTACRRPMRRAELLLDDEVLERCHSGAGRDAGAGRHPETWLAKLLAAYADLFRPPVAKKSAKTDVTQPLIQAVNLDEEEPPELSQEELEAGGRT